MRTQFSFLAAIAVLWIGPVSRTPAQTETAQPPKTTTNSIGMTLVRIEPGEFWMGTKLPVEEVAELFKAYGGPRGLGSEYPRHKVRITKPFYIGRFEVTKAEFRKFVDATNYQTEAERNPTGGQGRDISTGAARTGPQFSWKNTGWEPYDDTHPVVMVSWNDAQQFCKWLSKTEKSAYRLPTEAEWEYACRAGTDTLYWNGDTPENVVQIANVADRTLKEKYPESTPSLPGRDGYVFGAPVGSFPANPWGLHDMLGNVAEWTSEVYDGNIYQNRAGTITDDPVVMRDSGSRSLRGGSYIHLPVNVRSASRIASDPSRGTDVYGFRVVAVPGP